MTGLAYLLAAIVFLMVLGAAVSIAWRRGMKHGSRKRAWAYATIAFLAVYLPVFWDHIPTVLAHRYYCAKDGGLTVYKDPKVWLAEHKDELESLRVKPGGESVNRLLPDGWGRQYLLNKSVALDRSHQEFRLLGLIEVRRTATRLIDISTNDAIALDVQYAIGREFAFGGIKFWLSASSCETSSNRPYAFYRVHQPLFLEDEIK